MEFLNKLEEDIYNSPYTPDWWKERCDKLAIFLSHAENSGTYRVFYSEDGNIMAILANIFEETYIWGETKEDGKVESSQFERCINKYMSKILYSNLSDAPAIGQLTLHMIEIGLLKEK